MGLSHCKINSPVMSWSSKPQPTVIHQNQNQTKSLHELQQANYGYIGQLILLLFVIKLWLRCVNNSKTNTAMPVINTR